MIKRAIFYLIIAVAIFGLLLNLNTILFSLAKSIAGLAILAGVAYVIYFFFFLTEDQRKYKIARWKYRRRNK